MRLPNSFGGLQRRHEGSSGNSILSPLLVFGDPLRKADDDTLGDVV